MPQIIGALKSPETIKELTETIRPLVNVITPYLCHRF